MVIYETSGIIVGGPEFPRLSQSRLLCKQVQVKHENGCRNDTAIYPNTVIDILAVSVTYSQSPVQMQINRRNPYAGQQL
jgi:hypothetical protein